MKHRLCAGLILTLCLYPSLWAQESESLTETVGPQNPNHIVVPVNQVLSPEGIQVELPGFRPQVLALSPDGKTLATSGKAPELALVDPSDGKILQRAPLPQDSGKKLPIDEWDKPDQASYTGMTFSRDGHRLYLSNVFGSLKVFEINSGQVAGSKSIPLSVAGLKAGEKDIPTGLAVSPDGKKLYVALNMSNRLLELDLKTGKPSGLFNVGVAPYGVVLVKGKAYVSNWGGRRPDAGSLTGPGGGDAKVRVDPTRYIASEGSVSVVDLKTGKVRKEILTGRHASGMALAPGGVYLAVANASEDTVSVLDTRSDKVIETISLKWNSNDYFGASPNALTFDASGKTLYVCLGTQNAVGVVSFKPGHSKLTGLIPVGWYPGAVACDSKKGRLYVANIKGMGSFSKKEESKTKGYNSHQYFGTLSLIPLPGKSDLARMTKVVQENYRREAARQAHLLPRPGREPVPVPERAGEPSVFKHVVYIIKENRTYDQVLGDVAEGNGNASLCAFGQKVTPNQHKMVRDFVLLDNTYCSSVLSADGHNWTDSAYATDYLERMFSGWIRSYGDHDALNYSPTGFLWDNALAHGKTLRVYGEFTDTESGWKDSSKKGEPKFLDYYRDWKDKKGLTRVSSKAGIDSLKSYVCETTAGWNLAIPDQFRADQFIQELKDFEKKGDYPNLVIMSLPNNHTAGTDPGFPVPEAQVADNDLAFGRILEALGKSRFWKDTCVFSIEDDPQSGWDHVSGYRTTAFVASPYTKRHAVVHTNYNHTSLVHTIELILGLPPMNQMDATATAMTDCFMDKPDFHPFAAVPSNIPLDKVNPEKQAIKDPVQLEDAIASSHLPLDKADKCPEDVLNRILWHAQKGVKEPYPVWAVTASAKKDDDD